MSTLMWVFAVIFAVGALGVVLAVVETARSIRRARDARVGTTRTNVERREAGRQ